MPTPTHIAIHHSASKDGFTYDWEGIRSYHVNHNGWLDIGYNWGVEMVNGQPHAHVGRLFVGKSPAAHARGHNTTAVGVCLIGNYSLAPPPEALLRKAAALVRWLRAIYGIPAAKVLGHRELSGQATECPGKLFDMGKFRALVA